MSNPEQWHNDTLGNRVVDVLNRNRFTATYFPSRDTAVPHILGLIPDGSSVGIGGSKTVKTLELDAQLAKRGCELFDHSLGSLSADERIALRYKQLTSDVFLTSSNAVTLKGELVNCDGNGNRVAAMIFGPKKVIVVAGINKIVRDVEEADKRIKMYAAPMNNKRYENPNPCVQRGECVDCNNTTRICNVTTILSRRLPLTDLHVIIIGENLGF